MSRFSIAQSRAMGRGMANAAYFDPAQIPQQNPSTGNVTLGTGNTCYPPGYSGFPSSAAKHYVAGSSINPNACNGGPCTGLFAPKLRKGYIDIENTFQPRVGFAYQPSPGTVFRRGAGELLLTWDCWINIFPAGNPPFHPFVTIAAAPGHLTGLVDNPGAALNPTVAPPLTVTTLNQHLKSPVRWNWNLTVQQELPFSSTFSINYVGDRGIHNWRTFDINQPTAGALQANPHINVNYLRPYRGFAAIQQEKSDGKSNYNSLQVSRNRRFMKGLMVGMSYTFARSMDDSSNYRDIVPDTYNTSNLWGPSEYGTRHNVVINYLYALPFFANANTLTGKLLGGWQLSGNAQFQTGQPCGVGTNNDSAGVGEVGSFGCGTNTSEDQFYVKHGTPRILKQFAGYSSNKGQHFATTNGSSPIFTAPPAGTFNLQRGVRNSIYGPGYQNWNLSMKKKFAINERAGFEFNADAYNFINHPNWAQIGQAGGLNLTPTSAQFGQVTAKSTTNARNIQVGLRLLF